MNTDRGGEGAYLFASETEEIIGCAMEVLNVLGHGLLEKPYENALAVEFRLRGISFEQQPAFEVIYKNEQVGLYVPDLIVRGGVVVDAKTIDRIHHAFPRQLLKDYPTLFTEKAIHSIENLRGIPKSDNFHQEITNQWTTFLKQNRSLKEIEVFALDIDNTFGHRYLPPIR